MYNGITLVLSYESRYDRTGTRLLAGPPRHLVDDSLRSCGYSVDDCDIRLASSDSPLRAGTKFVILFGETSLVEYRHIHGLNEHRGYVAPLGDGVLCVATWNPIDCVDTFVVEEHEDMDGAEDEGSTGKDAGPTARANYPFWLDRDITKLLSGRWARFVPRHLVAINFATERDWDVLSKTSGAFIYFDIESHPETNTLQCFSYAIDGGPVLTCLVYDHTGRLYCDVRHIAILALALQRNTVVIHNACFDLPFNAIEHRIPFGKSIACTMIMHHRAWPEAEKSLHHAITNLTNAPYHKDSAGGFNPRNWSQCQRLLLYNAKDVETLRCVYKALLAEAESRAGLQRSFQRANASIYPYLIAGLTGIEVDYGKQQEHVRGLTARLTQLRRILKILVGYDLNPGSSKQCATYFHEELGYDVVKKTESGAPSLAGDALYMLKVKHPANTAIDVIIAVRDCEQQLEQLRFKPLILAKKR